MSICAGQPMPSICGRAHAAEGPELSWDGSLRRGVCIKLKEFRWVTGGLTPTVVDGIFEDEHVHGWLGQHRIDAKRGVGDTSSSDGTVVDHDARKPPEHSSIVAAAGYSDAGRDGTAQDADPQRRRARHFAKAGRLPRHRAAAVCDAVPGRLRLARDGRAQRRAAAEEASAPPRHPERRLLDVAKVAPESTVANASGSAVLGRQLSGAARHGVGVPRHSTRDAMMT
eukprot:7351291-Prymnesium_polylepis.2